MSYLIWEQNLWTNDEIDAKLCFVGNVDQCDKYLRQKYQEQKKETMDLISWIMVNYVFIPLILGEEVRYPYAHTHVEKDPVKYMHPTSEELKKYSIRADYIESYIEIYRS
jgi:hypothetical protein